MMALGRDLLITRTVMEILMDTHKKIREHISALSDGELSASDLELAFAALRAADGEQAWNTYHRIGDVLRAQATPELSDGFNERLAARLAAEPGPARRTATAAAPAVPAAVQQAEGAKKVASTTS
jgi:sigma-E factor negative regulatory protein RseA